jgi:HlyD family secretion protein
MRSIKSLSLFLLSGFGISLALLGAAGKLSMGPAPAHSEPPLAARPQLEATWAAAAPGRVEPRGRELRIGASVPAIIKEVQVQLNDHVQTGDLLIRLEDDELKAKLAAVKAEAAVRATERDAMEVRGTALDRRKAEDSLYAAERNAFEARLELDRLISQAKTNKVSIEDVEKGRSAVTATSRKLESEQANLKRIQGEKLPALTREEAALAAARAEVAVVSTSLERMRIRSPVNASVLELNAKIGETAGTGGDSPLLVLGDTTRLQVRAEVEERDVRKIYSGQPAVVKSDAFPDRTFDARVSVMARTLGAPQLTSRGQRKQTDVEVLEVILDLDEGVPLLPGMRTDVLFKEAEAMQKSSVAKTE